MIPSTTLFRAPGRRLPAMFLILACGLPVPGAVSGEALQSAGAPVADSARLRKEAEGAQREFERLHRRHLPLTREDWRGGGCDERVGVMCLRFEGGLDWEPYPEDSSVVADRARLLDRLAVLGDDIPGDRWILGQRVRYLGDARRWEEAEELARRCSVDSPWWCHALRGYVLHRAGRGRESLAAFQEALGAMDPGQAARWWDPKVLLDYSEGQWLEEAPGLNRQETRSRFWRLADPLFLVPGNSRLTEHLSRRFASSWIYDDSAVTIDLSWGRALDEVLVRYGFPAGWEKTLPELGDPRGSVVEHHHPDSRHLLPPLTALEDPSALPEGVWVPEDERPRSASAPVLAPLMVEARAQVGVLRRDGSLLVVASYAPPRDTLLVKKRPGEAGEMDGDGKEEAGVRPLWAPPLPTEEPDTLAGLFLLPMGEGDGEKEPLAETRRGGEGLLFLRAPPGRYLMSLENWSPRGRWGARIRHGIRAEALPPDVPTLSDLLLLEPGDSLPSGPDAGLPRMRPSTTVRSGEEVTVAWEVYGLRGRREPLTFRLSLVGDGASFLRRALNRVGLFRRDPPLVLSWTEAGPDTLGPLFRAVDVTLPEVEAGGYVLRLEMEMARRSKVVSDQRITVR
mgnify:CR=1 FL=1